MENLKREMDELKGSVAIMSSKVDMMFIAMIGSDITKDGGLVKRIEELEKKANEIYEEVEDIKTNNVKSRIYLNILWLCAGSVATGVFFKVLDLIFKN